MKHIAPSEKTRQNLFSLIVRHLNESKWKWTLKLVYDKDSVFQCWRITGFGKGSEIYLIQDFNGNMAIQKHLSVTMNGEKIICGFSDENELSKKLTAIAKKFLKNRKRAQARNAKKRAKNEENEE